MNAPRPIRYPSLLVPVDGSDNSARAIPWSTLLSDRIPAPRTFLYVIEPTASTNPSAAVRSNAAALRGSRRHEMIAESVRAWLAPRVPGGQFDLQTLFDLPASAILTLAGRMNDPLVVMSTHGRTGLPRVFFGSVAEGVVRQSSRPVLTIPPGAAEPRFGTILCPVNMTPLAAAALDHARFLASLFDSRLIALHVKEEGSTAPPLEEWLASVAPEGSCEAAVASGNAPALTLQRAADEKGDLIVVGVQQTTRRGTTVIGSTSERIVRHARVPVLIVPIATLA